MFKKLKLKAKMLLTLCSVVFIAFALTITFIAVKSGNMAKNNALDKAVEMAYKYSNFVKSKIDNAMDSTMILTQTIEGIKNSNLKPDPLILDNMVKQVLEKNSNFHGIWVMIDPDTLYKELSYYSWYYREGDKIVSDTSFTQDQYSSYMENEYYVLPKNSKKTVLIEPYEDEDLKILMTSACVPIMDNGKCIGVIGIDITLEDISKMVMEIHPFETGDVSVISNSGKYVAHTDKSKIGADIIESAKNIVKSDDDAKLDNNASSNKENKKGEVVDREQSYKNWETAIEAIKSGSLFSMLNYSDTLKSQVQSIFVPIKINNSDAPWSFVVNIPINKVLEDTHKITVWCIVIGIISIFITGIAITLFSGTIIKPINSAIKQIGETAKGDLTIRLKVKSEDEIGELAVQFNKFVENLQNIIKQISQHSKIMDSSSNKLLDIATHLYAGIDHTSYMAGNVSASTQVMSENLNNVASTMDISSSSVAAVASMAEEMAATINEITQNTQKSKSISDNAVFQSRDAANKMAELGKATQEITKIVEAITEISAQTNLLALNATIEAARAGESGKGFAVVAGEIKNLAKQTAEATLTIKEQIQEVQTSTALTVKEINHISEVITGVNEIASIIAISIAEQASTTKEIAQNISQTADGIENVNITVSKTTKVAKEITKDIENVNIEAKQMATNSTNIKSSAEGLKNMAEKLSLIVGEFKV
ncbi:MAG: methyl-accepting chemotaxis protein [Desulfamplus sp.]|nr:methyl-accepting chemotaxis protein [Desulfamplus sp.]